MYIITTSLATWSDVPSPFASLPAVNEDEGQQRVGGRRVLPRLSDNVSAGTTVYQPQDLLMESGECTDVDTPSSSGGNTEDIHAGNVTLDAHIDVRVTREEQQRHKAACATRWTVVTMRSRH